MAEELSEEQVAEFKVAFSTFDKNGDGTINTQELGTVMETLGMKLSEAELQVIISQVDTDHDGAISFQEFLAAITKRTKAWGSSEEGLRAAFRVFDLDGDGHITVDELKQAMAEMGEQLQQEELDAMIRGADTDQDGRVNYEEFVRIITQK